MPIKGQPAGPVNHLVHFIGANPATDFNPEAYPCIDPTAYVGPFSTVIGDVTLGANVFVASNVTIRADEGTPFFIGANSNLQDGVVLHGLREGRVVVDAREFSIHIGEGVTCAHGCLVHGPCRLENKVFVGFNAIILNAVIGEGSFVSNAAVVTDGVRIAANRLVPVGALIDTQKKADALGPVPVEKEKFAGQVRAINVRFPAAYALMSGVTRCSCGIAGDKAEYGSEG
ncbi:MAG: carbonate dehydratase [Peptococcaceae bacterium]|jgi:carbon dioxide concentrating mechanism protein CcmM|nr:carbonate dehydratase [Peptococcaceae bacterium]